jgi:hypothetical protein
LEGKKFKRRSLPVPNDRKVADALLSIEFHKGYRRGSVCKRCERLVQKYRSPLDRLAEV